MALQSRWRGLFEALASACFDLHRSRRSRLQGQGMAKWPIVAAVRANQRL